jgi:hypothetical protein
MVALLNLMARTVQVSILYIFIIEILCNILVNLFNSAAPSMPTLGGLNTFMPDKKEQTSTTTIATIGGKWDCPTCWAQNDDSLETCACCQTAKNSNGTTTSAPPEPAFKPTQFKPTDNSIFGLPSNNISNGKPSEKAVSFGLPTTSSANTGGFQFGSLPVVAPQQQSVDPQSSLFAFGQSKPAEPAPFTFNAASAAPNFNFGAQPATNGVTFQFSGTNSTSNLFNSAAPSMPTLGASNTFMPMSSGSNSTARKMLAAKRKKRV